MQAFEKHGLSKIEIVEKETLFDPNVHDALFQQPMEGMESDIVFAVVKSGLTPTPTPTPPPPQGGKGKKRLYGSSRGGGGGGVKPPF